MADGGAVRRRREAPERIGYRQALERLANFVHNELGNGRAPRARPDIREWRVQRARTIRALNEFKEKLDAVCVHANTGKVVGNVAEILGAMGAIVGAVVSLFGLTSGPKITNIGNMVHHTGTCIDNASKAIESLFSEEYLRKIEAVLKEDQELSLPLAEWLNFSNELNINMQEIFGVSLTSGTFNTVIQVFQEIIKFSSPARSFHATMRLMRQQRYSVSIGNDVKVEKLQKFYQHLSASPQFADKMRGVLSILRAQPQHVQLFVDGVRTYQTVMDLTSSSAVPTLKSGLNPEIPAVGEVSVFCFFQAISLANSVISLANAKDIIKRGTSQYSDALEQLTCSLAFELRRMEDL
ncbi:hypothetical protein AVEN_42642-1 [Araneus ventricosus]|uniref:Uncharacterized protein n=1 Tax=Araneus ventricosus TaxID=182803 RepID=A0A4Y2BPH9_ARAVE|nr:hypothetical protein AVEN_42642-1 [Araneus ventricosus]